MWPSKIRPRDVWRETPPVGNSLDQFKYLAEIVQLYALAFGLSGAHGISIACRRSGKLDGVKRMTARQVGRPEEVPFDEPAEEPPGKQSPYAEPSPADDPGRPVDPQPSTPPEFS